MDRVVQTTIVDKLADYRLRGEARPLISLLGPLMGGITTPYLDADGVAREVRRGEQLAVRIQGEREGEVLPPGDGGEDTRPSVGEGVEAGRAEIPGMLLNTRAGRARQCVLYLAECAPRGLTPSNSEIAAGLGIANKGQMSKLLSRLHSVGVLSKASLGAGKANVWQLTPYGREVARRLARTEGRV